MREQMERDARVREHMRHERETTEQDLRMAWSKLERLWALYDKELGKFVHSAPRVVERYEKAAADSAVRALLSRPHEPV